MRKLEKYVIVSLLLACAVHGQDNQGGNPAGASWCTHKDYQQLLDLSFTRATAADETLPLIYAHALKMDTVPNLKTEPTSSSNLQIILSFGFAIFVAWRTSGVKTRFCWSGFVV